MLANLEPALVTPGMVETVHLTRLPVATRLPVTPGMAETVKLRMPVTPGIVQLLEVGEVTRLEMKVPQAGSGDVYTYVFLFDILTFLLRYERTSVEG